MMPDPQTRCGFIAIIGAPNAGKSTLLNRLAGSKLSIVTPKAQTTRSRITGICIQDNAQLIFVDTPGIFSAERKFEQAMVRAAWQGIRDADIALLLVDASRGLREETVMMLTRLKEYKNSLYLALNKIDAVAKPELLTLSQTLHEHGNFMQTFMISALKGDGVDDIKYSLASAVPKGPWLFPEDHLSDIPKRLLAAEITREKLFFALKDELPYALAVETESWEIKPDGSIHINHVIYVQRESQKKIVVGKGGAMLKAIGTKAREDLARQLGAKVHLFLFVKVDENWKDNADIYRALGLEYKP